MRKPSIALILVCALFSSLFLLSGEAQAIPSNATAVREQLTANLSSTTASKLKEAVKGVIKSCPIIESKIQAKVTTFDNSKLKHLTVYANLTDRLSKVADRLTARGADVSVLRADLVVLNQKVAKFNTDYATYIAIFKASQESVCGASEGAFKLKLKEAKTALQLVHKDAADIRAFVNTTIKSDINKLKTTYKATTTAVTSTATKVKASVEPLVPELPSL